MSETLSSQHTQSFPLFLEQAGISLVVSTYQAGKLILLRADDKILNTHFVDMQKPMGMALQEPKLAIGTGIQVVNYYNMVDVAPKVEPVNKHTSCYLPRQVHMTGDIDIHEMAFADDHELWLINTRMSCLCTLSSEHSFIPRWHPSFVSGYDLFDRCHLNGLAMRRGKPAFVSALGETDSPGGWRENKASGGLLIEIESNRVIARGLSMPHSPRWYQDKLWVLESGAGTLAFVDAETGEIDTVIELPGFTRGLEFVGRYALIGLSQVRETAVFAGLPLTERCQDRQCGVWIVDIEEREIAGFVVFSGDVQEVFSVLVLPSSFPAILSMDNPLLRSSYSLPEAALKQCHEPDPAYSLLEQATLLHRQQQYDSAIKTYQQYLKEHPDHMVACYQLGVAYADYEDWQNAVETLKKVVARDPNHAEAWNSLGHAWAGLFEWQQALESYQQAIVLDQQYATAHFNRSLILLRQGHYPEGWKEYEWRWKMPSFTPFKCPQPQWHGENIHDKTILVHTEQGNGDAIQFARFLSLLSARCKRLIVVCPEQLRLFFKTISGVDEVRLPGSIPGDSFDVYSPIMSLPGIMNISLDNLPSEIPYWSIPAEVVVPDLGRSNKYRIGLVWAGSPDQKINHHRSIDLTTMLSLTEIAGLEFYSFQMPLTTLEKEQLENYPITCLEQELVSYAHTGALIQQMDLIISVCTSVAHVSASLGKPTWILLSTYADWRWLEDRDDSPWYPGVRLFRQRKTKDWSAVLNQVRAALERYAAE
ncbi:MAG TPA: TIGR03032 family protein [Crenotrichaceae bacterium]|nr:TIGR03032 family protein [Crenotrichaceae bacterium]